MNRGETICHLYEALVESICIDRRQFYQSSVLTMVAINRDSNEMLLSLSQAINALNQGDMTAARRDVNQAILTKFKPGISR